MERELDGTGRGSFVAWLRLAKPILATFDEHRVLVLDLGPSGALLSGQCHYEQGAEHELAFLDGRGNVKVRGLVTGVADHGLSSHRDLLVRFHERGVGLSEFIARYEEFERRPSLSGVLPRESLCRTGANITRPTQSRIVTCRPRWLP